MIRSRAYNQNAPPHSKSKTTCISLSQCKHKQSLELPKAGSRRLVTECDEIENFNVNLLGNFSKFHSQHSQSVNNCNVNVQNMEFNSQKGYIRKKERYRQIFGDRPKVIYVKP